MRTEFKRRPLTSAGQAKSRATDESRELAFLAEYMRHPSVASLAGDIAKRLGVDTRGEDLIAAAGLGAKRQGG